MTKRLAIVANPDSGSSKLSAKQIRGLFQDTQVKLDLFSIKADLGALARRLASGRYYAVVAVGGDGTVNTCAGLAAKYRVPLGVIPAGTLNHFAKDAGIPSDLSAAADVIVTGKTRRVDYATVSERVFVNNASIGIYPSIVRRRDRIMASIGKAPAALVAGVHKLFSHSRRSLTVITPARNLALDSSLLLVGNNSYHMEKIGLSNRTQLDRGKLYLYAVDENHKLAVFWSAILSLVGVKRRSKDLELGTRGPIRVESPHPKLDVAIDGEVVSLETPLIFRIHPRGLKLRVPR